MQHFLPTVAEKPGSPGISIRYVGKGRATGEDLLHRSPPFLFLSELTWLFVSGPGGIYLAPECSVGDVFYMLTVGYFDGVLHKVL